MGYLFDRVNADIERRVDETGGWGNSRLLVAFHGEFPRAPEAGSNRVSWLEGDDPEAMVEEPDLLVISLQAAWLAPEYWIERSLALLKPGGRLVFSSFGPDTLVELAEAWALVDELPHVHPFEDMHHLGDALLRRGFQKPILDADWMGVEYEDVDLLMDDLRREGLFNLSPGRRRTLTGKKRLAALREQFRGQDPVRMTFELVHGYAEAPQSTEGGIRVEPPSLRRDAE